MNVQEYSAVQIRLVQMGNEVRNLPLDEFMNAINRAETLVPVLDPTLYRRGADNLNAVKELAIAFMKVQEAHVKLQAAVLTTSIKEYEGSTGDAAPVLCLVTDQVPPEDAS